MLPKSYQLLGLELAPFVQNWGQIEEVKEILMAQAQLFTAQHTLKVSNADNRFTPGNPASPLYGRNLQLLPVTLSVGSSNLYSGLLRSVTLDHASRVASILTENAFTVAANYFVNLTTSGNPASIIESILNQAGLQPYVDPISFASAQAGFLANGATIGINYVTSGAISSSNGISGTTALSAIQAISSMCSLSCYVQGGLIRLQAYRPYQKNLSTVKWQITPEYVYDFSTLEYAYQSLSNSVNVGYGASSNLYVRNYASILANNVVPGGRTSEVNTQLDGTAGNAVTVPNLASAQYFADQFLARASVLHRQGSLTCGRELVAAQIGDRCSILAPNWGNAPIVAEIIETHYSIASESVELVVVTF